MVKRDDWIPAVIDSITVPAGRASERSTVAWEMTCADCGHAWAVGVTDIFQSDAWASCPNCGDTRLSDATVSSRRRLTAR